MNVLKLRSNGSTIHKRNASFQITKTNEEVLELLSSEVHGRANPVPNGWWKNIDNQHAFLDHVAKKLNIKELDQWQAVTNGTIKSMGGSGLLDQYNSSFARVLKTLYPDHDWHKLRQIKRTEKVAVIKREPTQTRSKWGSWVNYQNQKKFLNEVAKKLNIKTYEDWYNVTVSEVAKLGGRGFVSHYNNSLVKALKEHYPEYPWVAKRVQQVPPGYWKDPKNQRAFMDQLAKKLDIQKPEDWYAVTIKQVMDNGGAGLLFRHNKSLIKALSAIYSDRQWKEYSFHRPHQKRPRQLSISKGQLMLAKVASRLFPGVEVVVNRKHLDVRFPNQSSNNVQYDVYIPSLALALEYQGELHFVKVPIFGNTVERKQELDQLKMKASVQAGITLVSVPFWWDKTDQSLAATIKVHRPDIDIPHIVPGKPIPTSLPSLVRTYPDSYIPAMPLPIRKEFDPAGWWMSRSFGSSKLFWNGKGRLVHWPSWIASHSKAINLPKHISTALPEVPFEAQLCTKDSLQEIDNMENIDWNNVVLMIVDAPMSLSQMYEQRIDWLKSNITETPFLKVTTPILCKDLSHFSEFSKDNALHTTLRKAKSLYYQEESYLTNVPHKMSHFDYHFGTGKSPLTRCRGCSERIPKDQLRLKTILRMYTSGMIRAVEVSFCIKPLCLRKSPKYSYDQIKPFDPSKVWVENTSQRDILTKLAQAAQQ